MPRFDYAGSDDDPAVGLDAAIRIGVLQRVEARLSTTWYGRTPGVAGAGGPADGPTGIAGLRAGAKLGLLDGPRVALAVIPEVVFPVGNDELAGSWRRSGVRHASARRTSFGSTWRTCAASSSAIGRGLAT